MTDPELWARIEAYDFPRGFEDKLAAKFGGWLSTARTLREEYRRFVYLGMISDTEITPPEALDTVWHLHLTYSRDYWQVFCPKVLRKEFHHDPCDSPDNMPRYETQYAATLELYRAEFEEEPPLRVWPTRATWKPVWIGFGIAVLTACFGLVPILLGSTSKLVLLVFLAIIMASAAYAVFSMPYSPRTNGGCGGVAGCGGSGCGS